MDPSYTELKAKSCERNAQGMLDFVPEVSGKVFNQGRNVSLQQMPVAGVRHQSGSSQMALIRELARPSSFSGSVCRMIFLALVGPADTI
jgi:hypothetical protein